MPVQFTDMDQSDNLVGDLFSPVAFNNGSNKGVTHNTYLCAASRPLSACFALLPLAARLDSSMAACSTCACRR